MILTGKEIEKQVAAGSIIIEPFSKECITTNSYDFHLGSRLLINQDKIIDPKLPGDFTEITIPPDGYILQPDTLYLGHTQEIMGSDKFVPIIRGRSSTGRLGIYVHITADLIDIGSINQYTLMLHSVVPVRVYPNMKIGQVTFWKTLGKVNLYTGKYNKKNGPQSSQVYKDFSTGSN